MQTKLLDAQPRKTLFRIGDSIRYIFLVVCGEERLIRLDHNGGEVILQRSRGGFIAETRSCGVAGTRFSHF